MMASAPGTTRRLLHDGRDVVYLLHGFAGRPLFMQRLGRFLEGHGYDVRNWGYPSLRKPIAHHAAALADEVVGAMLRDRVDRVHFVTHSLGGIIVRHAVRDCMLPSIGRVVMLAPPNAGSDLARAIASLLGRICPTARSGTTS